MSLNIIRSRRTVTARCTLYRGVMRASRQSRTSHLMVLDHSFNRAQALGPDALTGLGLASTDELTYQSSRYPAESTLFGNARRCRPSICRHVTAVWSEWFWRRTNDMARVPGLSSMTPGNEAFGGCHWRRQQATDQYGGSADFLLSGVRSANQYPPSAHG
jgi:hypothetical protein